MLDMSQLKWNFKVDRELVSEEGGTRHVLVDVDAPLVERPTSERPPLNLALVIDASGSMSGGPLDAAKEAAVGIVKAVAKTDEDACLEVASDLIDFASNKVAQFRRDNNWVNRLSIRVEGNVFPNHYEVGG